MKIVNVPNRDATGCKYMISRPLGLLLAKELDINSYIGEQVIVSFPDGVYVDKPFMRAFLLPVAREIGFDKFSNDWKITGTTKGNHPYRVMNDVFREEARRLEKKARAKEKVETPVEWSKSGQMLIPEISTVIKLTANWTFKLFNERRNKAMSDLVQQKPHNWRFDLTEKEVTISAGSQLSVNRVYIRQGSGEYSSVTFYLEPNGKIKFGENEEVKNGKKKVRFWAKLSDVNKIRCKVDTRTL